MGGPPSWKKGSLRQQAAARELGSICARSVASPGLEFICSLAARHGIHLVCVASFILITLKDLQHRFLLLQQRMMEKICLKFFFGMSSHMSSLLCYSSVFKPTNFDSDFFL